jgi:uncharacterized membrane protein
MNDWEIKKLLTTVFSVQAIVWGVSILDVFGIQIPVLQPLFALFYLLFIPGVLILRVLRMHELGNVITLLYSVGLSVVNVMIVGLLLNTSLPFIGIMNPISMVPLLIAFTLEIGILSALSYKFDKYVPKTESQILTADIFSPQILCLCLLPFLSVFSTQLLNISNNPVLQLLLVVSIAALTIFIGFSRSFDQRFYPFSIFVIALSLLYFSSLVSQFLTGYGDTYQEYYVSSLVIRNSLWNSSLNLDVNAMLSITMLAPISSLLSGLDLVWIFKIVFPFLFSLVPLCLYEVFKRLTSSKIAFFSCILFVFSSTFYGVMLMVARQQIAELFLALVVLTMVYAGTTKANKSLPIIFAFAIVVSHYTLALLYVFGFAFVWLVVSLSNNPRVQNGMRQVLGRLRDGELKQHLLTSEYSSTGISPISLSFVVFFAVFAFAWFFYASGGAILLDVGRAVSITVLRLLANQGVQAAPQAVGQGLQAVVQTPLGFVHAIAANVQSIEEFVIVLGALAVTLRFIPLRFTKEYVALIWLNLGFLGATVVIPGFAAILYILRWQHIELMFLAPCFVIGVLAVLKGLNRIRKVPETGHLRVPSKTLAVFFAVFLLFNTGFMWEVLYHQSWTVSFPSNSDSWVFNSREISAAQWLQAQRADTYFFGDVVRYNLIAAFGYGNVLYGQAVGEPLRSFSDHTNWTVNSAVIVDIALIPQNSYIFLGSYNILNNQVAVRYYGVVIYYVPSDSVINSRSKIFDDGGARVYYG